MASTPQPGTSLFWRILRRVRALCDWSWVSWLILLMTGIVCYDTMARYIFSSGSVALQELQWHLFSMIFLLGATHTMRHDGHVRLDLWYGSSIVSNRIRAWVNILGHVFFLAPFCLLLIWYGVEFTVQAWRYGEGSPDPGGLPHRWLIKATIPAGFCLLLINAITEVVLRTRSLWRGGDGTL